ncbi:MAG: glycosyltransferase family 9 protein [Verrucomicrobiota bacterium]|jgi:ADP-heptose:LPS heptosyltransferase
MSPRKTLVIRGGALGDFILTLPALAALRRHFPGRALEILGYPSIASLAVAGGLAEGVSAIESPALSGFFARGGSWPASAAEYFAQFDLIVSYLYDPEGIFQSNATRCGPARFIAGPHRPDEASGAHAAVVLLRPLESLGIHNADPRPRLVLPEADDCPEGAWLALHPGSGSERKNWPEAKWAELLKTLAERAHWSFLVIGGEAEGERSRRLSALLPPRRARLAQNLPLVELAQKMRTCAGFIGHDSGITHLAAALDLPGLVLWGPASAVVWRPMSDKMRLLRDDRGLGGLAVETVLREVTAAFPLCVSTGPVRCRGIGGG